MLPAQREAAFEEDIDSEIDRNRKTNTRTTRKTQTMTGGALGASIWPTTRLSRVANIQLGKMLQNDSIGEGDDSVGYLRAANIQSGSVGGDLQTMYASPRDIESLAVRAGDLMVCEGGDVGRAALVTEEYPSPVIFQNSVHRVKPGPLIDSRFLYWTLSGIHHEADWYSVLCNKSTIAHLTVDKLGGLEVPVPPIEEQRRIADFLDDQVTRLDALVAKFKVMHLLVGEQYQSRITHAVSEQSNKTNWKLVPLNRVATVKARIGWRALTTDEYQLEGYAFLNTPNIKNFEIDFTNVNFINQFRWDESPELQLAIGDVLLAKDGSTLGITNVVKQLPRPSTVNGSIAVLRPFNIDSRFLRYVLSGPKIQSNIQELKDGMGVPHLFQRDINRLQIPFPDLGAQVAIADHLDHAHVESDMAEVSVSTGLRLLEERKRSLITAAVTGQMDVTTAKTIGMGKWVPNVGANIETSSVATTASIGGI